MVKKDKLGDLGDIFEILVTSYSQKGGNLPGEGGLCWEPAADAYETDETFVVQFDLAGMDPAGIEVLTDDLVLLVRGVRPETSAPGKKHFHKMEIDVGPFVCRVPISVKVAPASARASYRNGFLFVTFNKGVGGDGEHRQISINR